MPMIPDSASDFSVDSQPDRFPDQSAIKITRISLAELAVNLPAKITEIRSLEPVLEGALRDMGFFEADEVEILYQGLFGRGPLCVRLNQTLVALRINEAQAILVKPLVQSQMATLAQAQMPPGSEGGR